MVRRRGDGAGDGRGHAPEDVVQECVEYLRQRFAAEVESRTVREEHVSFPLPKGLRELTVVG